GKLPLAPGPPPKPGPAPAAAAPKASSAADAPGMPPAAPAAPAPGAVPMPGMPWYGDCSSARCLSAGVSHSNGLVRLAISARLHMGCDCCDGYTVGCCGEGCTGGH